MGAVIHKFFKVFIILGSPLVDKLVVLTTQPGSSQQLDKLFGDGIISLILQLQQKTVLGLFDLQITTGSIPN